MELSRLPRRGWGSRGRASRWRESRGSHPFFYALGVVVAAFLAADAARAAPGLAGAYVEYRDGLLTVEARNVALQELVEEVARQSGLVLSFREPLAGRTTMDFEALDFPVAIARLLRGKSYALQYGGRSAGAEVPVGRLWLFSSAGSDSVPGVSTSPQPPVDGAAARRLEVVAALADEDTEPFAFALASAIVDESPFVRYEAVYALGEIGGDMSTQFLELALSDPDPDVRGEAVDALAEIGGERSANALAAALIDTDPSIREDAVYALGEIGGETATVLLRDASEDPDEFVREAAAEMLTELEDED